MQYQYLKLYAGPEGYVTKLPEFYEYNVLYLSSILTIPQNEFLNFITYLKQVKAENSKEEKKDVKTIIINTTNEMCAAFFSYNELVRLIEILELADIEERTQDLINQFNI